MKQFGKIMLMVFGVGILAAGLSSIPSRPAVASVAAQVQVVNTPLPVQGTVDVSNFPPTQNVAITGTPTVNANVTFPSSVDVANPATAPLFVVNLDEPGRTPYQPVSACVAANISCESVFPGVPSNHRLVLQHISGTTIWSSAPSAVFGFARNGAGVVVTRFLAQTSDTTTLTNLFSCITTPDSSLTWSSLPAPSRPLPLVETLRLADTWWTAAWPRVPRSRSSYSELFCS